MVYSFCPEKSLFVPDRGIVTDLTQTGNLAIALFVGKFADASGLHGFVDSALKSQSQPRCSWWPPALQSWRF